jgi:hypothetical protein
MKQIERKPIPGYPEYYADRKGRIWRKLYGTWRVINPVTHHDGYQYTYVSLKNKKVLTQRLVCAAFKGLNSEDSPICIRKAKGQQPRRVRSQRYLKWGTHGDTKRKKYRHLTRDEQDLILGLHQEGQTQIHLAQAFGVSQPVISRLVNGKTKLRGT